MTYSSHLQTPEEEEELLRKVQEVQLSLEGLCLVIHLLSQARNPLLSSIVEEELLLEETL
jgi:hypothetical protein